MKEGVRAKNSVFQCISQKILVDASVFSEFGMESECEYVLLLSCDNKFIQVGEGLHILTDASDCRRSNENGRHLPDTFNIQRALKAFSLSAECVPSH